jgi:hypothetical protein
MDLLIWGEEVLLPAIERVLAGDKTLREGRHCKFCPAISGCPLKHKNAQELAKMAFDDDYKSEKYGNNSAQLTDEQLSERLNLAVSLEDYIKGVKQEVLARMKSGYPIPQWKLVAGRSIRKWTDEGGVILKQLIRRTKANEQMVEDMMEEPTVRSPAQIEKVLKRYKLDVTVIFDGLVRKPPGRPSLAREEDPRPALSLETAAQAFDETYVTDDDDL